MTTVEGKLGTDSVDSSPSQASLPFFSGHSPGASRKSSSSDDTYKTNGICFHFCFCLQYKYKQNVKL